MPKLSPRVIIPFVCAEKGICISTASLWILLVYTEASLRLKDLKTSHANLSHLFAAHWCVDFISITLSLRIGALSFLKTSAGQ